MSKPNTESRNPEKSKVPTRALSLDTKKDSSRDSKKKVQVSADS